MWQPARLGARVHTSTVHLILGTNVQSLLTFNSDRWDSGSIHSTTSNTSRVTAVTSGRDRITGNIVFTANSSGGPGALIRLNGSIIIVPQHFPAATAPPAPM